MIETELEIDCGELGTLVLTYELRGLVWEEPDRSVGEWSGYWDCNDVRLVGATLDGAPLPREALLLQPFERHLEDWRARAWSDWFETYGSDPHALYDDSDDPHWSEVA